MPALVLLIEVNPHLIFRPIPLMEDLYLLKYEDKTWPSGCNVYLIKDERGGIIFDTGVGADKSVNGLLTALNSLNIPPETIHTIILTHAHIDHIGGAAPLVELSQGKVYLSEQDLPSATDIDCCINQLMPYVLQDLYPELVTYNIKEDFLENILVRMLQPDECKTIHDGEKLITGRYTWEAIHTPGHDIGHMVYYEPHTKMLISGDFFAQKGATLLWYSSETGGIKNYLSSLEKVGRLSPKRVLPAHGDIIEDPQTALETTRKTIFEREQKVLELLSHKEQDFQTLDNLVLKVSNDLRRVAPWCSSVVHEHLLKLASEGKVQMDEQKIWKLVK